MRQCWLIWQGGAVNCFFERPAGLKWCAVVHWTAIDVQWHICSLEENAQRQLYTLAAGDRVYSVPLLKSNLQKCVRRQRVGAALATVDQLMRQDAQALLRRLPIIVLEDSRLCHGFVETVWCMAALSKGWQLSDAQCHLAFELCQAATECPQCDAFPTSHLSNVERTKQLWEAWQDAALPEPEQSIIASILLRVSYGGTEGDLAMLLGYGELWLRRFIAKERHQIAAPILKAIPRFTERHQLPEAVDFHCTPILRDLSFNIERFDEKLGRELMWHLRSNVNCRKATLEPSFVPEWWKEAMRKLPHMAQFYWCSMPYVPEQKHSLPNKSLLEFFAE